MRLSAVLSSPTAFPWLAPLKSAQLQRIARATGIQSSGTKGALLERIEGELGGQVQLRGDGSGEGGHFENRDRRRPRQSEWAQRSRQPWSILSIDMGIQNLAFAHLRVPPGSESGGDAPPTPELTAWHRLAVSEIGGLDLKPGDSIHRGSLLTPSDISSGDGSGTLQEHSTSTATTPQTKATVTAKANDPKTKETFSPSLYAANAYTLITTLLSTYNPTHILIERQRFRSGGGSAVLEWTLRVGVLEGMLYAVLHALRHERGGEVASVQVHGVEPRRVVRYWVGSDTHSREEEGVGEDNGEETEEKRKKKKSMNAREVKKVKIDLVGEWLSSSLSDPVSGSKSASEFESEAGAERKTKTMEVGVDVGEKISMADDRPVQDLASAYLRKWRGQSGKRKEKQGLAESGGAGEVGKLDDLADCLLQGVTWLEWQVMRARLARDGVKALEGMKE